MKKNILKTLPSLKSDEEAELFVEHSDLSEYDLSTFTPVTFEFESKTTVLNMRLPQALLSAVKNKAKAQGMPYSRYIRFVLEQAIVRQ